MKLFGKFVLLVVLLGIQASTNFQSVSFPSPGQSEITAARPDPGDDLCSDCTDGPARDRGI